jgi:ubiquinone/menaquinone biosynthesis C-methylase UbiE
MYPRKRPDDRKQARSEPVFTDYDVARYWDKNADIWTQQVRDAADAFREHFNNPAFIKFIGDIKGKQVLDAGCGEGYNTRIFAGMGAHMSGIDISAKLIDHAREEEKRHPLGIRYEVASYSEMPMFQDRTFDTVVSTMALMDGADFEGAMREIYRVLKPGGDLHFSITHPCFMTPGFGWTAPQDEPGIKLTVSGYFNKKHWIEQWRFSGLPKPDDVPPFAVPCFGRTLSDYVNPLLKAGFILKGINEPRPTPEACRAHPFLNKWRKTGALFLHVHSWKMQNKR